MSTTPVTELTTAAAPPIAAPGPPHDIHAARDGYESEIRDRLEDADAATVSAWWEAKFLAVEVWESKSPGREDVKRVELTLTVGGPTVWIEYDGRWGEHGRAHFNHSWGWDCRPWVADHAPAESRARELQRVEMNAELVEQLLEAVGVL